MTRSGALSLVAALLVAGGFAACVTEHGAGNPSNTATGGVALASTDVDRILASAATAARNAGVPVAIAVTDREGEVLGVYVTSPRDVNGDGTLDSVTDSTIATAISKAATAAAFESDGEAFTTRTAYFIVQGHYPPGVQNAAGGPLFGVQDSSQGSSDAHIGAFDQNGTPAGAGVSGEYGGIPLYLNGTPVGGIGVDAADVTEKDAQGATTLVAPIQSDLDELIARAGSQAFDAPPFIQATNVYVDGIQFPYFGPGVAFIPGAPSIASLGSGVGAVDARYPVRASPLAAETVASGQFGIRTTQRYLGRVVSRAQAAFVGTFSNVDRPATVAIDSSTLTFANVPIVPVATGTHAGVAGDVRFSTIDAIEPPPAEGGLTAADVNQVIDAAVANAQTSVAGIRLPRGRNVVVHVAVVDRRGNILGVFRMADGTLFSFDIAVQKARTAAFFSTDGSEGLPVLAASARGIGFLAQPFFPPGIDDTSPGPLARLRDLVNRGKIPVEPMPSLTLVSPPPRPPSDGTTDEDLLTPGFQRFDDFGGNAPAELAAVRSIIASTGGISILADRPDTTPAFVSPGLEDGLMTFPGAVPLYKNGKLVGAVGVSGDGVDEDDDAAEAGSQGFAPPSGARFDEASETTIATVLVAKVEKILTAIEAHPDARIRNVYAPIVRAEVARIADRFAQGLGGVTIPYTKLPRNPGSH